MGFQHSLGWLADREDRSFLQSSTNRLLSSIPMRFSAPEEFNPASWLPVLNQGQMGSCTGWGRAVIRSSLYYIATGGQKKWFSPLFGYFTGQMLDGLLGRDTGATIASSIKAAKQYGDCFEEVYPYPNPVRYPSNPKIPQNVYDAALPFNEIDFVKCSNYDDVWRLLASGHAGISIGIPWTSGIVNSKNGRIEVSDLTGQEYGGHCNAVIGWVKEKDSQGRNYLVQPNSHGPEYGNNGVKITAPACFDHWGKDGYSEMIAIVDRQKYEPGRFDWRKKNPLR